MATTLTAKVMSAALDSIIAHASSLSTALDIAHPNVTYEPTSGETYLQADFIPNGTQPMGIDGGDNQHLDLLQITVVYPLGGGDLAAMETAGGIAEHFKSNTRIDADGFYFRVTKQPDIATPFTDQSWRRLPVTISLETLT